MDTLLLIGAVVLGLIIGLIVGIWSRSGKQTELEAQVRAAQAAADGTKRDLTNAQSEMSVKQSHINTLNANIGILEEKLRRAEQGGGETTTLVARLQDDLRAANTDRPALEAELRQRDLDLSDLHAQLEMAQASALELQGKLDDTHHLQLDAERRLSGLAAATIFSVQGDTDDMGGEKSEDGDNSDTATLAKIEPDVPSVVDLSDDVHQEAKTLRSSLATMAFTGADLARALNKRNKEYDELLARFNAIGTQTVARDAAPSLAVMDSTAAPEATLAGPADVVASGAALAVLTGEEAEETTTAIVDSVDSAIPKIQSSEADETIAISSDSDVAVVADERASLAADVTIAPPEFEATKTQLAGLNADLQRVVAEKGDLTAQLQARDNDLYEVTAQLATLKEELGTANASRDDLVTQINAREAEIKTLTSVAASAADALKKKEIALDEANSRIVGLGVATGAATVVGVVAGTTATPTLDVSAEVKAKDDAIADLTARLDGLKNVLNARAVDAGDAHVKLALAQNAGIELDDLRTRYTEIDSQRSLAISSKSDLESQFRAKAAYVEALQDEMARMRDEHDSTLVAKVDEIGTLTASVATAGAAIKQKDDLLAEADAKLAMLQTSVDTLNTERAGLLGNFDTRLDEVSAAKFALEAALKEKDAALSGLQTNFEKLNTERASLVGNFDSSKAELDTLNIQVGDLRKQLDELGTRQGKP